MAIDVLTGKRKPSILEFDAGEPQNIERRGLGIKSDLGISNGLGIRRPDGISEALDRNLLARPPENQGTVTERRNQITQASPEAQQQAARNRVTGENRGELRDDDFDREALLSEKVAGLTENAVKQKNTYFSSVAGVPNLADPRTKEAFDRFYGGRTKFGNRRTSDPTTFNADQDPTRAAFQNQFFPSETLSDVGIKNRTQFRIR